MLANEYEAALMKDYDVNKAIEVEGGMTYDDITEYLLE